MCVVIVLYSRARHNCNGKLDYVPRRLAQVTTQHGRFVYESFFYIRVNEYLFDFKIHLFAHVPSGLFRPRVVC